MSRIRLECSMLTIANVHFNMEKFPEGRGIATRLGEHSPFIKFSASQRRPGLPPFNSSYVNLDHVPVYKETNVENKSKKERENGEMEIGKLI